MKERSSEPLVTCRDLTYIYVRGGERLTVLDRLNVTVNKGDFVAIMGPSGSGKTTLLNLIGGLDQASSSTVEIHGLDLASLSKASLAEWRANTVGFVFQFYNLLGVLTALGNVELPLLLTPLSKKQRHRRAMLALSIVGLADRATHKPGELSGGQQQRVAIARALVADPALLVCDEPTGDLDRDTADEILELLQILNREFGKTIIMVTHDAKAAEYARSVLHMDKGNLLEIAA
ncbi:MAG: ABC transporter ATP-binding protein [Gammaproteobacteria bacterium]|nr:ABC transporter ATP-binding protein [Gammaproteobacteria bacterium]